MGQECVGAIVCKLDMHKKMFRRGYIAMLAVDSKHRRKSIGEIRLYHRINNRLFSEVRAESKLQQHFLYCLSIKYLNANWRFDKFDAPY